MKPRTFVMITITTIALIATTSTTYTATSASNTRRTSIASGQPLVEVTNATLPSSIPATGGNNISISCQRPISTTYGVITVVNQGTGGASLKLVVVNTRPYHQWANMSQHILRGRAVVFCRHRAPQPCTSLGCPLWRKPAPTTTAGRC